MAALDWFAPARSPSAPAPRGDAPARGVRRRRARARRKADAASAAASSGSRLRGPARRRRRAQRRRPAREHGASTNLEQAAARARRRRTRRSRRRSRARLLAPRSSAAARRLGLVPAPAADTSYLTSTWTAGEPLARVVNSRIRLLLLVHPAHVRRAARARGLDPTVRASSLVAMAQMQTKATVVTAGRRAGRSSTAWAPARARRAGDDVYADPHADAPTRAREARIAASVLGLKVPEAVPRALRPPTRFVYVAAEGDRRRPRRSSRRRSSSASTSSGEERVLSAAHGRGAGARLRRHRQQRPLGPRAPAEQRAQGPPRRADVVRDPFGRPINIDAAASGRDRQGACSSRSTTRSRRTRSRCCGRRSRSGARRARRRSCSTRRPARSSRWRRRRATTRTAIPRRRRTVSERTTRSATSSSRARCSRS